ncbi:MAG: hypothetical protein J7L22_03380 [Candidatus Marinimicrobia bacterium]|nr:hypothetical protein [Candidatus Neomarinimicrobiota bacterium]
MDKYLLIVLIIFFDIQCGNNTKVESNIANSTNKYQPQVEDSTLLQNIKQIKKEKKNLELKIQKVEKEKSELMASIQKSKRETNKLEHKLKVVKARSGNFGQLGHPFRFNSDSLRLFCFHFLKLLQSVRIGK